MRFWQHRKKDYVEEEATKRGPGWIYGILFPMLCSNCVFKNFHWVSFFSSSRQYHTSYVNHRILTSTSRSKGFFYIGQANGAQQVTVLYYTVSYHNIILYELTTETLYHVERRPVMPSSHNQRPKSSIQIKGRLPLGRAQSLKRRTVSRSPFRPRRRTD